MLNSAFDGIGATPGDYYPAALRAEIDQVNERVYATVNNGVYRAGFATTQAAYDEAVAELFATLDWLEDRLAGQRYLVGDRVTEADWRLFTTLLRFDPVYHGHFKCNLRRLVDYPHLWAYTRELYQWPGVAETVDFAHIKGHYYASHGTINPTGIVPKGPLVDFADAARPRGAAGGRLGSPCCSVPSARRLRARRAIARPCRPFDAGGHARSRAPRRHLALPRPQSLSRPGRAR